MIYLPGQKYNSSMLSLKSLGSISALLFVLGTIVNILAYLSIAPVLVFLIFLGVTLTAMRIIDKGGYQERTAVLLVFVVCWFWAGISAISLRYINEYSHGFDAIDFYALVSNTEFLPGEGFLMTEDSGAVIVWNFIYTVFSSLGFEKAQYIGVSANIFFVALTALIGIKIVKKIFNNDRAKVRRFTIIYATCGLFWMLSSIHIRDGMVLFIVTFLVLRWVYYLTQPNLRNMLLLAIASIFEFLVLGLFRTEFVFVPLAMILAGLVAKGLGNTERIASVKVLLIALLFVLPTAGFLVSFGYDDIANLLANGNKSYTDSSLAESDANSLGNQLIVTQPAPLRLLFGSAYMFINPIPFWAGLDFSSMYHFYKSLHVIFMYFVTPLFGLALWRLVSRPELRTSPILFLAFTFIGFTLSIAFTSLEGRHFGSFLVPFMVLAVLPDIDRDTDRNAYASLLVLFLSLMFLVHLAWGILKLIT